MGRPKNVGRLVEHYAYKNQDLAIAEVADYMDVFYNRTRATQPPGRAWPEQFEPAHTPHLDWVHTGSLELHLPLGSLYEL